MRGQEKEALLKPQIIKNKTVFLISSPFPWLLSIFFPTSDPLGHFSCPLTSVPLIVTTIFFLLCLVLIKPFSLHFYKIRLPLPPTQF